MSNCMKGIMLHQISSRKELPLTVNRTEHILQIQTIMIQIQQLKNNIQGSQLFRVFPHRITDDKVLHVLTSSPI
ncbi:hypothetical protein D3C81_1961690 [compost metagenome]